MTEYSVIFFAFRMVYHFQKHGNSYEILRYVITSNIFGFLSNEGILALLFCDVFLRPLLAEDPPFGGGGGHLGSLYHDDHVQRLQEVYWHLHFVLDIMSQNRKDL